MERNAGQKKPDLKTAAWRACATSAFRVKRANYLGAPPPGDGGGTGARGGWGLGVEPTRADWNSAEFDGWHGRCLRTGALTATRRGQPRAAGGTAGRSQRDREAARRQTTPYCATLYSALKRLTSEECQREENKGVKRGTSGTNAQYVLATAPGSKADAQPRSEYLEREA